MTQSNGTTAHVEVIPVNFADAFTASELFLCKFRRFKGLRVGEHLSGKCFMHINEINIRKSQSCSVEGNGSGIGGAHQKLLRRIERRERVGLDVSERHNTEGTRLLFIHQQKSCCSISER